MQDSNKDLKPALGLDKDNVSISEAGIILSTIDAKKERSVVWKLDLHLLPLLAVMYLFNSLDKGNMGMPTAFFRLEDQKKPND